MSYLKNTELVNFPKIKSLMSKDSRVKSKEYIYKSTNANTRMDYYRCNLFSFNEMLDFYVSCERPAASMMFPFFWEDFKRMAPKNRHQDGYMKIYRGTSHESFNRYGPGYVWTCQRELAEDFAKVACSQTYAQMNAIDRNILVLEGIVRKRNVVYHHINNRSEDELFIEPTYIMLY